MSSERIVKALLNLGLSQTDAKIYIYLATEGPSKARRMINGLTINGRQVYRSLKRLRNKGITIANDERPSEFSAVPFEAVLDLLMKIKKEQADALQASKEKLISAFRTEEKKSNAIN